MAYEWKTVVPPVFVSEFTSMMENIMNDPENHEREPADRVEYDSYAIVTPEGRTFWKIYTDDLGKEGERDPTKNIVFIHQSSQAPNVEYILAFRDPSDDAEGFTVKQYGPYKASDKEEMICVMTEYLMEEGMEVERELTKLKRSLDYKAYWDVQSQMAASAKTRKHCHRLAKELTLAYMPKV